MMLKDLFEQYTEKGNQGNQSENGLVTDTGLDISSGNRGNQGNHENNNTKAENEKIIVTCWTPSGIPINVEANDAEHAAFLARANPNPKDKKS